MSLHKPPPSPTPSTTGTRPQRIFLQGEEGRTLTLAQGAEAFLRLDGGSREHGPALVLGLGVEAGAALATGPLRGCKDVQWLECPAFMQGMIAQQEGWATAIPPAWHRLDRSEARHETGGEGQSEDQNTEGLAHAACAAYAAHAASAASAPCGAEARRVYWHTQNLRLFPSFWGPVLGAVQAALLGLRQVHAAPRRSETPWRADVPAQPDGPLHAVPVTQGRPCTVLLPGGEADLLHRELAQAFAGEGLSVCPLATGQRRDSTGPTLHTALRQHLKEDCPALFFSVNGRGLDAQGVDFALLRACGVPVALWLVDNPWHILSGWRQGWWRGAHIFVTDHSFIAALRRMGAASVHHLPLAVAQHMAEHQKQKALTTGPASTVAKSTLNAPALIHFVGRASFPARDKFFAAACVPQELVDEAQNLLDAAPLPDFHWWAGQLGVELWPGYAVRAAGLGAERCAALRRARWLEAALPVGLAVHGDTEGWRALLPEAPAHIFHPAVDYYGALAEVYAGAAYSLNVTSLLLPAGLTQRHFDVWAAGGFLLSDHTPGLDIFPAELTREMAIANPQSLPEAVHRLERDAHLRRHLQCAWQDLLSAAHTYAHRVRRVLEILGHY